MMAFTKPMVTIELDEYTLLKEQAKPKTDDDFQMAKEVIAALLNSNMDMHSVNDMMVKKKIRFWIQPSSFKATKLVEAGDIYIQSTNNPNGKN